jgi:hypothetical protein
MQLVPNIAKIRTATSLSPLVLAVIPLLLLACATTPNPKGAGVVTSREATDIWHSYDIYPNYNYYYSGPDSQPNYIIGIDDTYRLVSKLWKPVDLTPDMLKNWLNFTRPRVGYSQSPWGAFIVGPNGERIGLWYSVRDWRLTGSATLGDNNEVAVTTPSRPTGPRETKKLFYK